MVAPFSTFPVSHNLTGGFYIDQDAFTVLGTTSSPIDTLTITVNDDLTAPEVQFANFLGDINVTAVPDQASTVGLLSMALVPLIGLGVRQRRLSAATK